MSYTVLPDFSVLPTPRVIRIEPSSACNLHCVQCPSGSQKGPRRGVMSDAVFKRIISEIQRYKNVDVVVLYHGGEPFLSKNIINMIKTVKQIGIRFAKTTTNGMAIKEEMVSRILKSGIDCIEFSLDGNSPEENDRMRKGSDYRQVASIIKSMLIQKDKLNLARPDIVIANSQMATKKNFTNVMTPKYLLDDFRDFGDKVLFRNTFVYKWPGSDTPKQYELLRPRKKVVTSGYCNQLHEVTTIRWNGDVVPCCFDIMSVYVVGNIMRQPLSQIWNNEKYRDLRKSVYERKFKHLCLHCNEVVPHSYFVLKDGTK